MKVPVIVFTRLLLLLAISTVCFLSFFHVLRFYPALLISAVLVVLYVVVRISEVRSKALKQEEEQWRVSYLPFIIISKRIITSFFFLMVCVLLLAPETRVMRLLPIPAAFFLAETLYFIVSVSRKNFSIIFFDKHLYLQQDRELKILAEEVVHVEYRYENFYLVLMNKVTVKFNPEFMPAKERENFRKQFMDWATRNKLTFTEEASHKLSEEKTA